MNKSPAFQFYPKDFLANANVLAMNLAEVGAYWTLISVCWVEGSLPAEEKALARLLRVSLSTMRRMWPAIEPCFQLENGRLHSPMLEEARENQRRWRERAAKGGRAKAKRVIRSQGGATQVAPSEREGTSPEADAKQRVGSARTVLNACTTSSSAVSIHQSSSQKVGRPTSASTPRSIQQKGIAHGSKLGDVPTFLHREFVQKVMNGGASEIEADEQIRAFYSATEQEWSGQIVGDEPIKFWRARFAEGAKPMKSMSNAASMVLRVMGGSYD